MEDYTCIDAVLASLALLQPREGAAPAATQIVVDAVATRVTITIMAADGHVYGLEVTQ
jgi:hypothetical protein